MPPRRFIAIASVSCASLLIDPKLMAPVVNRLTISLAGSTSSSGMGLSEYLSFSNPRRVHSLRFFSSRRSVYSWNVAGLLDCTACWSLLMVSGLRR